MSPSIAVAIEAMKSFLLGTVAFSIYRYYNKLFCVDDVCWSSLRLNWKNFANGVVYPFIVIFIFTAIIIFRVCKTSVMPFHFVYRQIYNTVTGVMSQHFLFRMSDGICLRKLPLDWFSSVHKHFTADFYHCISCGKHGHKKLCHEMLDSNYFCLLVSGRPYCSSQLYLYW